MMDNIKYIDKFLDSNFLKVYSHNSGYKMTVDEAAKEFNGGVYLITMQNHITCCIDGTIYDIFNPGDRTVWEIYKVKRTS